MTTHILVALLSYAGLLNAANEKVYQMGPGGTAPRVISKVEPTYTEEARAAKINGSVLLKVIVGADGVAHDINVVRSLDAGLDVKAVEAVQQWKFQPGMKDEKPVAVQAQIEVNFKLL